MVDTQRFAIWHPPGMPDNNAQGKKNATITPQQQTNNQIPRGVKQVLQDYNWLNESGPSTSTPRSGPSRLAPAPSSYRPPSTPQLPQLSRRTRTVYLEEVDEEDESDDYTGSEDEEPVVITSGRQMPPSRTPAPNAPITKSPVEDRAKTQDMFQFTRSREPAHGVENRPVQFPTPSAPSRGSAIVEQARALPMKSAGSGAVPQRAAPAEAYTPRRQQPEPMIPSASKLMQPNLWNQRPNSVTPVPPKVSPPRPEPSRSELRESIPQSQPKVPPTKAEYSLPGALDYDFGYLAYNSSVTLDVFLTKLQETALTEFKMSMMEASIRQFHLIAADADIQLTRELVSINKQDMGELRPKLIERHRSFLEAQAHNVLDGLHGYHAQFWEKCLKPAHEEPEWEEPFSKVPVKESLSIPKQQEDRSTEIPIKKTAETFSEKLPEVWKPNFVDDSEPPTPKLGNVGLEDIFERFQMDMERDERATRAPVIPSPASFKSKPVTNQTVRNQAPAKIPTITAQDNSKGSSGVSSKKAAKLTESADEKQEEKPTLEMPQKSLDIPLEKKPLEKPMEKPLEKPSEKPKPTPEPVASKPTGKPKTAKELRAEKKKGKNKAVPADTRQTSDPLDSAIEDIVVTGDVDGMLEHTASAWR